MQSSDSIEEDSEPEVIMPATTRKRKSLDTASEPPPVRLIFTPRNLDMQQAVHPCAFTITGTFNGRAICATMPSLDGLHIIIYEFELELSYG